MGLAPPTLNGIDVPKWEVSTIRQMECGFTMKITRIGLDLAKKVMQVHGVDSKKTCSAIGI